MIKNKILYRLQTEDIINVADDLGIPKEKLITVRS